MKQKRIVKSKEQLLAEAKQQEETLRKRSKVKNTFYPFLVKHSKSVEDAKTFIQAMSIAIHQAFNNQMKKQTVKDLGLVDMLDPKSDQYKRYKEIFCIFEDENLKDALEMIEGMNTAIDGFIREENMKRPLKGLKTSFL